MMVSFLEGMAAALLAGSVAWSSYLASRRLLPEASAGARWSGAFLLAGWSLVALFWLLSPARGFRLAVVLPLWLGIATAATLAWGRGPTARCALCLDASRALSAFRSLDRLRRALAVAVGAVAAVRILRGLAEPPLGWDALTYHLVKAGRWVQEAGFAPFRAPDAWGYYDYFAEAGDVLWAWAMLPVRGDALIVPAGALVWVAGLVGVYAVCRELGARRNPAASAALAVGAMPAVLSYLTSAYVDNVTLAAWALGSVFVVRLARGGPLREASLAVAGLALAVGTKLLAAPLLGLGLLVVAVRWARDRSPVRLRVAVLGLCLVAVLPGLPSYARAWMDHGSPLYPFSLEVAGRVLSAGNEESQAVGAEILADPRYRVSAPEAWAYLFSRPTGSGSFLGFGLGVPFLILLAVASPPRWHGRALAAAYLAGAAAALVALFFSGALEASRTTFMVTTAARYLTPGVAALAALASLAAGRLPRILWAAAILGGLVLALPRAWALVEAAPVSAGFAVAAAVAAGMAIAWRLGTRGLRWSAAALTLVVFGVAGAALETARAVYRYPVYRAAADPVEPLFHMHPLQPLYAAAWPLWQELDHAGPLRLAVTAGFDGLGHNWYLYPLLGRDLQNRVTYAPVTRDGSLVDYRDRQRLTETACFRCWLERLVEAEVDHLISLPPRSTVEDAWARAHPDLLELAFFRPNPIFASYRLDRANASAVEQSE